MQFVSVPLLPIECRNRRRFPLSSNVILLNLSVMVSFQTVPACMASKSYIYNIYNVPAGRIYTASNHQATDQALPFLPLAALRDLADLDDLVVAVVGALVDLVVGALVDFGFLLGATDGISVGLLEIEGLLETVGLPVGAPVVGAGMVGAPPGPQVAGAGAGATAPFPDRGGLGKGSSS